MKRALTILLASAILACGEGRTINGSYHDTYGLFSESTDKDPNVCYKLIVGNLVWSFLLLETIVAPVYFVGWSLWEPAPDNSYCKNKFTGEEVK